ncbi:uncharacterized protein (TIGR03083 family) [Saccharothrix tamanrassetensis]|uniref:Uncharacterized protein (TIGR03083 family) n=1 Tax=Saccharothrix tamanrassetensis TaxID=1051531 RepID=A0A841CF91_9PSEU|nr:maleylpyruvate isomerase family mycothiol-dependent enzyme [Saccharothrix tamanrassetensis]MBB5954685.1 uncharacterized protein (TIGR03083 family) [Saccharothrix tamanrassetensis]
MEHQDFLTHARAQYLALRAAATAAGPEAPVPTCPGWNVHELVRHLAGAYSWGLAALRTPADGERPHAEPRPEGWEDLLAWWDDRFTELDHVLAEADPDTPAWTFAGPKTVGFWARRLAHETAVHRLDVEHALHGPEVPTLLFDSEFAADGVDEYLTRLLVRAARRSPIEREGRLLFHAADAGRAWELRVAPGEAPVAGPITDAATDGDTAVAGTADALYRVAWGRPSGAIVTGDRSLLDALPRP